ncbi:MAG TPA: TetR/AcrR family transcriptional regulator [Dehalococcoidia bacterium]|nr:TetR/AcrR family transcriptional regulator [Dehalococcoidia bacterium]
MVTQTLGPVPADARLVRSRAAILEATGELLIESGAGSVTIERVSERSGVAKTTIYRHFSSRSRLIFEAFESLLQKDLPSLSPGPIRDQLVVLLQSLIAALTQARWAPAVPSLVEAGERDAELQQLIHDFLVVRMEPCRRALREAIQRGQLVDSLDIDAAVAALAGPIFYRRLVSREPLNDEFAERVVDQFLAANARP